MMKVKKELNYAERYRLLPIDKKAAIREAMTKNGISEVTVFRWIREQSMPEIWQKEFSKHLETFENATPC
jgi:hypothetical protein